MKLRLGIMLSAPQLLDNFWITELDSRSLLLIDSCGYELSQPKAAEDQFLPPRLEVLLTDNGTQVLQSTILRCLDLCSF